MKNAAILLFSVSTAVLGAFGASAADRHPLATRAEAGFFNALTAAPENRSAAIGQLTGAYAVDPSDARTSVLLGLAHLWAAAEGSRQDPAGLDHLILAEKFLARAAALDPNDERIPSWLVPARVTLATIERDPTRVREAFASLHEAYLKRPAFHSFSLALLAVQRPPNSPEFQQGLAALRKTIQSDCLDRKDIACGNRPHWPHNAEGYLYFASEYEALAGNVPRSAELLASVRNTPEFATWPYRKEFEEFSTVVEAAKNDPAQAAKLSSRVSTFAGGKCRICHGGK